MNKQTQTKSRQITMIALCCISLFSTAALAQKEGDILVGEKFTVDGFNELSALSPDSRVPGPTCQIVISGDSGLPTMVCEGADASGNKISCVSDKPPFSGALLAFSANKAELLANLGEPEAECSKL